MEKSDIDQLLPDDDEDDDSEEILLDLEKLKDIIPTYTNQKLCEVIVADRYLGINQEIAIMCMEELGKRRAAGDTFAFEKHIDATLATLPPLNLGNFDIRTVLQQAIKVKGKR